MHRRTAMAAVLLLTCCGYPELISVAEAAPPGPLTCHKVECPLPGPCQVRESETCIRGGGPPRCPAIVNVANGTLCSDGNACTQSDVCQAGTCVATTPVVCTASDQCHDAGTCDPATGLCSDPAKADGTTCSNGNACTVDACVAGVRNSGPDLRTCPAAPTSGAGGVSCTTDPSTPGCWGTSCTTGIVSLPAGCESSDTDGDGLPDAWEDAQAIDLDCDGVLGPNDATIPGANKYIADVYLRASATEDDASEALDLLRAHLPTEEAVRRVVAMFGGSHLKTIPVRCDAATSCSTAGVGFACSTEDFVCLPTCVDDGDCAGLTDGSSCVEGQCRLRRLHFNHSEINLIPHTNVVTFGPVDPLCITDGDTTQGVNFYDIKADPANVDPKTALFMHYGVYGHFQRCDSVATCFSCPPVDLGDFRNTGKAELIGNDLAVTLGSFLPPRDASEKNVQDSGVTAHELGHNLGLRHGGPDCQALRAGEVCDDRPDQANKVNYLSVMNPWYQFGIPTTDVPGSTIFSSPGGPQAPSVSETWEAAPGSKARGRAHSRRGYRTFSSPVTTKANSPSSVVNE